VSATEDAYEMSFGLMALMARHTYFSFILNSQRESTIDNLGEQMKPRF
jgi:hypothetical protein